MVRFAKTPKMSTYLVAFVISDFPGLSSIDMSISIWARSDVRDAAKYAHTITPKLLKSLEDFTNIKYNESGLNKIDFVAIPDFAAGAMENWGLLTYRYVFNTSEALLHVGDHNTIVAQIGIMEK